MHKNYGTYGDDLPDMYPQPIKRFRLFKTHKVLVGATPLMEAALFGNVENCMELVAQGEDIHAVTEEHGASVLHFAVVNKLFGTEITTYFLSIGCNMYEEDRQGEYPLDYAIREEAFEVAHILLSLQFYNGNLLFYCIYRNNLEFAKEVHKYNNALVKEINPKGLHAIHFAANYGDASMCQWLVDELGVDIEALSDKSCSSALHYVGLNLDFGEEDLVPFFILRGLYVNQTNKDGTMPIHSALSVENIEVAEALYGFNADLKTRFNGKNLMFLCVEHNETLSAKWLHEVDAEQIRDTTPDGRTIFHVALIQASAEMCMWLYLEGVDPTITYEGNDALHLATHNRLYGREVVRFCIETLGLDANGIDQNGDTPVFDALMLGNIAAADELCKHGAQLRANKDGEHLLVSCLSFNRRASVQFLYHKDKRLFNDVYLGRSMAHYAAMKADFELFKWLAEEAKIDMLTGSEEDGSTVLHFACTNRQCGKEIAEYAISTLGMDVNSKRDDGTTPLAAALICQNLDVAELFCTRGATLSGSLLARCVKLNLLHCAKFVYDKDNTLVEEQFEDGLEVFHYACTWADLDMCKWLLSLKESIDPHKLGKFSGTVDALHFAATNASYGAEILAFLVNELKMEVNKIPSDQITPLYVAVHAGNVVTVKALCELGADLSIELNKDLLECCIWLDALDVAKVLHEYDSTLIHKIRAGGKTSLHIAAQLGNARFCRWLVEKGVHVEALTNDGESVIDLVPWFDRDLRKYFKITLQKLKCLCHLNDMI